jgi:hypothetical protein
MQMIELSDAQWCVLDLLMRARERGVGELHRLELTNSQEIPAGLAVKLVFAALTIPDCVVSWTGEHTFAITPQGIDMFRQRFGDPSPMADAIVGLPDPARTKS